MKRARLDRPTSVWSMWILITATLSSYGCAAMIVGHATQGAGWAASEAYFCPERLETKWAIHDRSVADAMPQDEVTLTEPVRLRLADGRVLILRRAFLRVDGTVIGQDVADHRRDPPFTFVATDQITEVAFLECA